MCAGVCVCVCVFVSASACVCDYRVAVTLIVRTKDVIGTHGIHAHPNYAYLLMTISWRIPFVLVAGTSMETDCLLRNMWLYFYTRNGINEAEILSKRGFCQGYYYSV